MNQTFGVAGVQMEVSPGEGNIPRMAERLYEIKSSHPWVELVFFSELCLFGWDMKWAQSIPGPATDEFSRLAKDTGLWLVPGSLYEPTRGGNYNSAPVINPDGEIVAVYRKVFPWRPWEKTVSGNEFCVFDVPGRTKVGLCICYDLWFPEVARQLAWQGAEVIVNPVMTATADRPLELVLSRANAIAQQVYFLSVNGLGHGGIGGSIFVGPEDDILAEAGEDEAVLTAELDLARLRRIREEGTLGVCQVLKCFRDDQPGFPVYSEGPAAGAGFANLGRIKERKTDE